MRRLLRVFTLALFGISSPVFASGMSLHIWIAEEAANEFVHIPQLKEFLQEQEQSYKSGSIFPDSGYAVNHPFGEYAHWHNFLNSYYQVIDQRCPDLVSEDCRRAFAHFLGVLSHDIADVNFDRHFVTEEANQDHGGDIGKAQTLTDPGCDFLAILEYKRGFQIPPLDLPETELLEALNQGSGFQVSAAELRKGAAIQKLALAGEPLGSPFTYFYYKSQMSWGSKNYYAARGGVQDTARRIAHAWELVWMKYQQKEAVSNLFQSIGSWPYVDFYVADELLEDF